MCLRGKPHKPKRRGADGVVARWYSKYPATRVTTGINEARVDSRMPTKFAARLQAATASDHPVLLSVDYSSGHGLASSKKKRAARWADIFAFALWQTGHPDFQPDYATQMNEVLVTQRHCRLTIEYNLMLIVAL